MLRLRLYIVGLIVWLLFVFNVERLDLDIGHPDLFDISMPTYIAIVLLALGGFVLAQYPRVALWQMLVVTGAVFWVAERTDGRPALGGGFTYLSIFELVALLITAFLAFQSGRQAVTFFAMLQTLIAHDADGTIHSWQTGRRLVGRQMQTSRRSASAVTIIVLEPAATHRAHIAEASATEIRRVVVRQQRLTALTRLLPKTVRATDFVFRQREDGRIVLIMPEIGDEQIATFAARLNAKAERRLGLRVRYGIGRFPQDGVTFAELAFKADQALQPAGADGSANPIGSPSAQRPVAATLSSPATAAATVQLDEPEHSSVEEGQARARGR